MFASPLHNETKDPNESQVASLSWPLTSLLFFSSSLSLSVLNAKAARPNEITKCPSAAAEQNKLRHQMSDNQNVTCKDKERADKEGRKGRGGVGGSGAGRSEVDAR